MMYDIFIYLLIWLIWWKEDFIMLAWSFLITSEAEYLFKQYLLT